MNLHPHIATTLQGRGCPARQAAYSLIEVLVAVLLLTVIVVGLLAMFGQTQQAFRVGMAQTDITENGRSVMNMAARELAEAVPSGRAGASFLIAVPPGFSALQQDLPGSATGVPARRTYVLNNVAFLRKQNKEWSAISYKVEPFDYGYGALYRIEITNVPSHTNLFLTDPMLEVLPYLQNMTNLAFLAQSTNQYTTNATITRVSDGIVHFNLRPVDTDGSPLAALPLRTNIFVSPGASPVLNSYFFGSNAVPLSLGLEIGILPPRMVERARAMPDAASARQFLSRQQQAGAVEMYRQRISLPNADLRAYQ